VFFVLSFFFADYKFPRHALADFSHYSLEGVFSMEYRFNEASVALPSELVDKSLQTFTLADGKQGFNVVVSRAELESGETLQQLCERLVAEWESKLPQFMLVDREARIIDGEAAEFFDCRWKANGVVVNQWHIVALSPKPDRSGPFNGLIITGTCQKNFVEPYTEIYGKFIASFRWRKQGER
jgi:hypothetical protein